MYYVYQHTCHGRTSPAWIEEHPTEESAEQSRIAHEKNLNGDDGYDGYRVEKSLPIKNKEQAELTVTDWDDRM